MANSKQKRLPTYISSAINTESIENDTDIDNEEPIALVVDASGLTVSKKGDYIEDLFSKKFSTQKVEAGLKIMLYNKFISS